MVSLEEKDGEKYVLINPKDVDFSSADKAQKIADVYAVENKGDSKEVITKLGEHEETKKTLKKGDWQVYNVGNVKNKEIDGHEKMSPSDLILAKAAKAESYAVDKGVFEESYKTEGNAIGDGFVAKTSSPARDAASVPFNFVIEAPWGENMYMKKGGVIVNNGGDDIYGVEKSAFENTYGKAGEAQSFAETNKNQIMARKSPVKEVVFEEKKAAEYEKAASQMQQKQVA